MKSMIGKKVMKIITVIAILMSMLVAYIPAISHADDEVTTDYVQFDAQCGVTGNVRSGGNIAFTYNFTLRGVSTGFRNAKLTIKDGDTATPQAKITSGEENKYDSNSTIVNNGRYSIINYGNIRNGTTKNGTIDVKFERNLPTLEDYQKTITFIFEADYKDPVQGITQHAVVEKDVTVTVESEPVVDGFLADVKIQSELYGDSVTNKYTSPKLKATYRTGDQAYGYDYIIDDVTAKYGVTINTNNACYGEYKLILKPGYDASAQSIPNQNTAENLQIDLSNVPNGLTTNIDRKEDGTAEITFTFGENKASYTEEDARQNVTYNFPIYVKYIVLRENSWMTIQTTYTGLTKGLKLTTTKNGTTIENKTSNYSNSDYESFLTASKELETGAGIMIKGVPQNIDEHKANITNGYVDVKYESEISFHERVRPVAEHPYLYVFQMGKSDIVSFMNQQTDTDGNVGVQTFSDENSTPKVIHRNEDKTYTTTALSNSDLKLKKITITQKDQRVSDINFYKKGETTPFFTATSAGDTYICPEGEDISEYYATAKKTTTDTFEDGANWIAEYTIPTSILTAKGLTSDNIENITEVRLYQEGLYSVTQTEQKDHYEDNFTLIGLGSAKINDPEKLYPKVSYMFLKADNFDTSNSNQTTEHRTIELELFKNNYVFGDATTIVDKNPTFYVKLPNIFMFENISATITQNTQLSIKNVERITIDSENYIKIECEGTYDSSVSSLETITITLDRTLIQPSASKNQTLEAYMFTENENYYTEANNGQELTYNETTPRSVFKATKSYTVSQSEMAQTFSGVKSGRKEYIPNSTDSVSKFPEKEYPLIVRSGTTLTFNGRLANTGKVLENVNMVYKLPVDANQELGAEKQLLENNFKASELCDGYLTKYATSLNNPTYVTDGVTYLNHINKLTNLKNIKVYSVKNGRKTLLSPDKYTIKYSNDLTASYNSAFTLYEAGTSNTQNATAIQVLMNRVEAGEEIRVEFEMDMPSEAGMVGAQFGAQYNEAGSTEEMALDSEAVYIINGNDKGSIEIQKVFEGFDQGYSPVGVNIDGINFKLKDEDGNFVQSEGNDLVATTDTFGKATFTNLEPGQYQVVETTQIPGYQMQNIVFPNVKPGEKTSVTAFNKLKTGTITISKTFEDTNEIKGSASFSISRQRPDANDQLFFNRTATTDSEGKVTFVGVPYGTYTITETTPTPGYGVPTINNVILNSQNTDIEVPVENPLGKGTIVINKTVPEGESVKELKFKITGLGLVSYVNKQGVTITNDTDLTIDLNQDYSGVADVNVEIPAAQNETQATITLSNLPLGSYTIEEIEIPKVGTKQVEKYMGVTRTANLENNGATETINITNRKKVGYLQLQKTAFVQEGETQREIGDKSDFQIRITGTSDYGRVVDETISTNELGKAAIALEIGTYTVKEVPVDGYEIYYKNAQGQFVKDTENQGVEVNIEFNDDTKSGKTTTQEIKNVLTGVGYVRIEKSLEGINDPNEVKNAGIKFKITGKNVAGGPVNETINIDKIDTQKNVAYGVSNAISVGGDYELEEIESTIPKYFEGIDARSVNVTTAATENDPLVIPVTNLRGRGNLDVITKTEPEGGILTGIEYKVTEIKMNEDGSYTKLDGTNGTENTVTELKGNNGTVNTSFAQLEDIRAGYYLVEQTEIPDAYYKDHPQIVEVLSNETGHAIFTIIPNEYVKYTKLIINKKVVNSTGSIATSADYEAAELTANAGFEVKLTNTETNKEYYAYISGDNKAIIEDLPEGTYTIEEQYKHKYELVGYYNVSDGIETTELTKDATGKSLLEIQKGTARNVITKEITIKNKINTDAPFGGNTQIDNYSKVKTEDIEIVTQSIIYVLDEEGNSLPGVQFKIMKTVKTTDELGHEQIEQQQVNIGTEGNVLTTTDAKLVIRGLDPGKYTLVNVSVPNGYLQPEAKEFVVYTDATQISRVEIQRNIPRSSLTLSTSYTRTDGSPDYVPRSIYKVVEPESGEVLKFTKTASGDYRKSNLEDASEDIIVKSGEVKLLGLEPGTYEVGIVGITDGFGMQKDVPETVTLVGNDNKNINVEVMKPKIVMVRGGNYNTMCLDESGNLWIMGRGMSGEYGDGTIHGAYQPVPTKLQFPEEDVFITSFDVDLYGVMAVDNKGRIWCWGGGNNPAYTQVGNGQSMGEPGSSLVPVCLSEIDLTALKAQYQSYLDAPIFTGVWSDLKAEYENGVKIVQAEASLSTRYLLDSNGKLWAWGNNTYGQLGDGDRESTVMDVRPTCISDIPGNPLYEAYQQGIKLVKIADLSADTSTNTAGAIDSLGRVWMWGKNNNYQIGNGTTTNSFTPICISDIESEFSSAKIVDLSISDYHTLAVDEDGNVWGWGYNYGCGLGDNDQYKKIEQPTKLPKELFGGARIKKAYAIGLGVYNMESNSSLNSGSSMFIDEYGRLWQMGRVYSNSTYSCQTICISNCEELSGLEIKQISYVIYNNEILVLDSNGSVYGWGNNSQYGELGGNYSAYYRRPKLLPLTYTKHLAYNLKFKKVYSGYSSAFAIDENGRLWSQGAGTYAGLGQQYGTSDFMLIPELAGEEVVKFSYNNGYAIALTIEGKVFVFGNSVYNGIMGESRSSCYTPVEITNRFNLNPGVKLVDVDAAYSSAVFIDSEGKVWVCGYNGNGQLGTGSTSSVYEPICISDEPSEPLYNVKMKKMNILYEGATYGIDDQGRVWFAGYYNYSGLSYSQANMYFGSNSYVTRHRCLTDISVCDIGEAYEDGVRFVDVAASNVSYYYAILLDSNGVLWNLYPHTGGSIQKLDGMCGTGVTELKEHPFGVSFKVGTGVYYGSTQYDGKFMFYQTNGNSDSLMPVIDAYGFPSDAIDVSPSYSYNGYAIDSFGQIWQGSKSLAGIIKNQIYGIKMKKIIKDGLVEADTSKGEIYDVGSAEASFVMYSDRYLSDYLGRNIVQIEKHYTNSLGSSYVIALDDEGKLWTWGGFTTLLGNNTTNGSTTPICISDIENTKLEKAYRDNPGFKIERFEVREYQPGNGITSNSFVIAYDNRGKIWTWGNNVYNQLGNNMNATDTPGNNVNTPICSADIQGTELYLAYESNPNFEFTTIYNNYGYVFALDNNNDIWVWGETYTAKGSLVPVCISNNPESDLYKERQKDPNLINRVFEGLKNRESLILYNGKLWVLESSKYGNSYGQMGVGNTDQVTDVICIGNIKNTDLYNKYHDINDEDTDFEIIKLIQDRDRYTTFALDSEGKIWAWGNAYASYRMQKSGEYLESYGSYILGTGRTTNELSPVCISDIANSDLCNAYLENVDFKITDIEYLNPYSSGYGYCNVMSARDNQGNLWVWGRNIYGELGNGTTEDITQPYCVTKNINAEVEKVYLYDRTIDYGNYYFTVSNGVRSNAHALYDHRFILFVLDKDGNLWSSGGSKAYQITHEEGWDSWNTSLPPMILGRYTASTSLEQINSLGVIKDFKVILGSDGFDRIIAYGNENKFYTWGSNYDGQIGDGTKTRYYNDANFWYNKTEDTVTGETIYQSALAKRDCGYRTPIQVSINCTIDKIIGSAIGTTAIDTEGRIWKWTGDQYEGSPISPTCYTTDSSSEFYNKTVVELYYSEESSKAYIVDNEGNMYSVDKSYYNTIQKITLPQVNGATITNIYFGEDRYLYIEYSDNSKYRIDGTSVYTVRKAESNEIPEPSEVTNHTGALSGKTVVDYSEHMAIDSDGNLYGWGAYKGIYDATGTTPVCITTTVDSRKSTFQTNNVIINKPVGNDIYGKKIAELYTDSIVKDVDGTYWYFTETGKVVNLSTRLQEKVNPLYGQEIIKELAPNIILASDNKIYTINGETITYLFDYIDGEVAEDKFYLGTGTGGYSSYYYIAIDTNGKVWTCGNGQYGQLGNGKNKNITKPVCISDIEGTDFYNAYTNEGITVTSIQFIPGISSSKPIGGIIALDSKGRIWSWGPNITSTLGNGTTRGTNVPICISTIAGTEMADEFENHPEDAKIEKVIYASISGTFSMIAEDHKGRIWRWGLNSNGQLITGDNLDIDSPKLIEGPEGIHFKGSTQRGIINKGDLILYQNYALAIDQNGKLWSAGSSSYVKGTNSTDSFQDFTCVNDIEGTELNTYIGNHPGFEFVKGFYYLYSLYLIDNDGKIWVAGNAGSYYKLGTGNDNEVKNLTCISNIQGTDLYNAYQSDTNFKIVDIKEYSSSCVDSYIDSNGKTWKYDNSKYVRCYELEDLTVDEVCNNVLHINKKYSIDESSSHIVLDTDGNIWSWGDNRYGQLGDNTKLDKNVPVCINNIENTDFYNALHGTSTKIIKITGSVGYNYDIYALDTLGNVWRWGDNTSSSTPKIHTIDVGTELYEAMQNDPTLKIVDIKDWYRLTSDGSLYNSGGQWVYNGSTSTRVFYKKQTWPTGIQNEITNDPNFKIVAFDESGVGEYVDNYGRKWSSSGEIVTEESTDPTDPSETYDITTEEQIKQTYSEQLGIEFTTVCLCRNTETRQTYICLDVDGKVWLFDTKDYMVPTCLNTASTISGNGIYEKAQADANFKITSLVKEVGGDNTTFYTGAYALDSNGKVWHIQVGKTVSNVEDDTLVISCSSETDLELENAQDLKGVTIERIQTAKNVVFLLDNNGEVWSKGKADTSARLGYSASSAYTEEFKRLTTMSSITEIDLSNVTGTSTSDVVYATDVKGRKWEWGKGSYPHISGYTRLETISEITSTGVQVQEVLDLTHIRDSVGNIYEISSTGNLTMVSKTYTPEAIGPYDPVEIPGVTVVKNTNYKALDDEGNLYVWDKYTGGFTEVTSSASEAINSTETEYVEPPVRFHGNGWSTVKAVH